MCFRSVLRGVLGGRKFVCTREGVYFLVFVCTDRVPFSGVMLLLEQVVSVAILLFEQICLQLRGGRYRMSTRCAVAFK
jgi:hypothetical protein